MTDVVEGVRKPAQKTLSQKLLFEYRSSIFSLKLVLNNKWMMLVSSLVIAISLDIPAVLYISMNNMRQLAGAWDDELSIQVFLKKSVDQKQAIALRDKLMLDSRVASVELITATDALQDFAELSRLGEIMQNLKINPLPNTLRIFPKEPNNEDHLKTLVTIVSTQQETEQIQFDQYWVRSFSYMLDIVDTVTALILQLLLIGVFVLISHNISFLVSMRSSEIRILKLIGATDSFVTRPFVYLGMWLGLLGGVLATIMMLTSIGLVQDAVDGLIRLYKNEFVFQTLGVSEYLLMLVMPTITGMIAAFFSCRSAIGKSSPDRF